MAMRRYTKAEFEAELTQKWKLQPTGEGTATTRAWKTPRGRHILVPVLPHGEAYPDYLLDRIVEILTTIDENPLAKPGEGPRPMKSV